MRERWRLIVRPRESGVFEKTYLENYYNMWDTISIGGIKYVIPEKYAENQGIAVSTVYYQIKQGHLETTKAFKKIFVRQS